MKYIQSRALEEPSCLISHALRWCQRSFVGHMIASWQYLRLWLSVKLRQATLISSASDSDFLATPTLTLLHPRPFLISIITTVSLCFY